MPINVNASAGMGQRPIGGLLDELMQGQQGGGLLGGGGNNIGQLLLSLGAGIAAGGAPGGGGWGRGIGMGLQGAQGAMQNQQEMQHRR